MLRVAIDIGGTFTDVVAETTRGFTSAKVLTTPTQPETGALDALQRVLTKLSKCHTDITSMVHGTTLATNALIERRGAKTALLTTAGFRDVIEMRYEKRFDQYALNIEMPEPLVARPLRLGIDERILANGEILASPADSQIDEIARTIKAQQVEAIAIGFLHSYKYPQHEQQVATRLAKLLGDSVTICQSAEVAGEIREYERFSTVCANAYVRPIMARYLSKLLSQLRSKGFTGSFLMMLSDGGLTTLENAMKFPIRLVEGGPAGGVALAAHVAREIGSHKTLALDIGGTTAKICFIENGEPNTARRFEIARAWCGIKGSGLPVKVPTVELVEIGAGGGSIASVDTLGRLNVGPKSAGSEPGPAAYDRGGSDATVTDAHLTVGNLAAAGFAGGEIALSLKLAQAAIKNQLQIPLGFDAVESAAAGIVELADETMANAARVHGIELGLDVSSFDLLVSGGGGGLHGARIAEKLGIKRMIVPANAGVGSAVGFLRSPVAYKVALSVVECIDMIDADHLTRLVNNTLDQVYSTVSDAIDAKLIETSIEAEVRYQGQAMEQTFELDNIHNIAESLATLKEQFRERYNSLYGFVMEDIPIELATVSIRAKERQTSIPSSPTTTRTNEPQPDHYRDIYDVISDKKISYRIFTRETFSTTVVHGPVVLPEAQTTTLVRPGWQVSSTTGGHLLIEREH